MTSLRNVCTICLLVLVFVTSAATTDVSSSDSSSSEELQELPKKPIERQPIDDGAESSDSDSDKSGEVVVGSAGFFTKPIMREQGDNGDGSSERRKKRHAFFYRIGTQLHRED